MESEYQVNPELSQIFLRKVLIFIRLFVDELSIKSEKIDEIDELDLLYHYGKLLIMAHDHYGLLALYWENYFFDYHNYVSQQKVDKLFQETPQLARNLDFVQLIHRAEKFEKLAIFRKLVEIALQYDLSEEKKKLAFDALLIFQCKFI